MVEILDVNGLKMLTRNFSKTFFHHVGFQIIRILRHTIPIKSKIIQFP